MTHSNSSLSTIADEQSVKKISHSQLAITPVSVELVALESGHSIKETISGLMDAVNGYSLNRRGDFYGNTGIYKDSSAMYEGDQV